MATVTVIRVDGPSDSGDRIATSHVSSRRRRGGRDTLPSIVVLVGPAIILVVWDKSVASIVVILESTVAKMLVATMLVTTIVAYTAWASSRSTPRLSSAPLSSSSPEIKYESLKFECICRGKSSKKKFNTK